MSSMMALRRHARAHRENEEKKSHGAAEIEDTWAGAWVHDELEGEIGQTWLREQPLYVPVSKGGMRSKYDVHPKAIPTVLAVLESLVRTACRDSDVAEAVYSEASDDASMLTATESKGPSTATASTKGGKVFGGTILSIARPMDARGLVDVRSHVGPSQALFSQVSERIHSDGYVPEADLMHAAVCDLRSTSNTVEDVVEALSLPSEPVLQFDPKISFGTPVVHPTETAGYDVDGSNPPDSALLSAPASGRPFLKSRSTTASVVRFREHPKVFEMDAGVIGVTAADTFTLNRGGAPRGGRCCGHQCYDRDGKWDGQRCARRVECQWHAWCW